MWCYPQNQHMAPSFHLSLHKDVCSYSLACDIAHILSLTTEYLNNQH